MRDFAPSVQDQNECGSCVGHGLDCGISATLAARGKALGFTPSPHCLYGVARCIDRREDYPHTDPVNYPPLEDVGTEVLSGIEAASQWGVIPTDAPIIDSNGWLVNSDCVESNVNDEPLFDELVLASTKLIVGARQIISIGPARITEVCLALDAGHAVVFGTMVDSVFMQYGPLSPSVGIQDEWDPKGGGHCMTCLGYKTGADSRRTFICRNSWGCLWGKLGDFECSEAFVKQWQDLFALEIEVKL